MLQGANYILDIEQASITQLLPLTAFPQLIADGGLVVYSKLNGCRFNMPQFV